MYANIIYQNLKIPIITISFCTPTNSKEMFTSFKTFVHVIAVTQLQNQSDCNFFKQNNWNWYLINLKKKFLCKNLTKIKVLQSLCLQQSFYTKCDPLIAEIYVKDNLKGLVKVFYLHTA